MEGLEERRRLDGEGLNSKSQKNGRDNERIGLNKQINENKQWNTTCKEGFDVGGINFLSFSSNKMKSGYKRYSLFEQLPF